MSFRPWNLLSLILLMGLCACTGTHHGSDSGNPCAAIPSAPAGLRTTEVTHASMSVAWTPVKVAQGCSVTYQVFCNGAPVATSSDAKVAIADLESNTTYAISVTATNPAGTSQPSATLLVKTLPTPAGLWTFNDSTNLGAATIGQSLQWTGDPQAVGGPSPDNGAVLLPEDVYGTIHHGIAANGGGSMVNRWTLMMDLKVPALGGFSSLFQTDPSNSDDGDCFIDPLGCLGSGATGYTTDALQVGEWYRLVVVVDNGNRLDIYLDGTQVLSGSPGAIDDRYALDSRLLLGADNDGERLPFQLAEVRIFDRALSAQDVAAMGGYSHGAQGPVMTGPYLQNVKTDGITVMWETRETGGGSLEYGTTVAYGKIVDATSGDSGAGTMIFKATLTGLHPGTTYHYRSITDQGPTPDATFTTAPSDERNFSFGVWGDSQGLNPDNPTDPMEPTKSFMKHMVETEKVDFAVTTGDLAEDGDTSNDVRAYFLNRPVQIIGTKVPFFIAWGNHDEDIYHPETYQTAIVRSYADLPSQSRSGMGPGFGSYSFDYAGCHFICVDDATADTEVAGWVRQDLQSPSTLAAKFVFVFIHRAPWYDRWYEGEAWLRTELVPYLEQSHAVICFSGHMHGYERGQLNGVHYVTTGGGSWLDTAEALVNDWPNITVGGYHNVPEAINHGLVNEYMKIEVTGNTCTAKMLAFDPAGTYIGVLDTFQVVSPTR